MLTREEITDAERAEIRRVLREARPKPRPPLQPVPPPKPAVNVQERWNERVREDNKPTVQIINETTAHNQAFARRMERERAEDRRGRQYVKEMAEWNVEGQDPRVRYQRELDRWWESQKLAEQKARLFAGLNENPRTGSYSPIARFEREMED
jgi:hypothetical protein